MRIGRVLVLCGLIVAALPSLAHADGYLVPFVGANFGNDSLVSVSQNDFAYSLGGGVMGFFSDHFGIRGDIRYFRNFQVDDLRLGGVDFELGTFDFSRATGGAVFRF